MPGPSGRGVEWSGVRQDLCCGVVRQEARALEFGKKEVSKCLNFLKVSQVAFVFGGVTGFYKENLLVY